MATDTTAAENGCACRARVAPAPGWESGHNVSRVTARPATSS
ncbi:hypothetical protein ATL41_1391 [Flavimobilis soli]|uniref:Uncharacterized protein n=1 Tax=Flavimobilis soli TaxID=442709 RepID=A0A2A9ECK0_9MICO|nr:hypothetical protein [Flavimobilis soli]PFG36658.1 hypothetical protein ATL41_1391 [Flavimobilis soli]